MRFAKKCEFTVYFSGKMVILPMGNEKFTTGNGKLPMGSEKFTTGNEKFPSENRIISHGKWVFPGLVRPSHPWMSNKKISSVGVLSTRLNSFRILGGLPSGNTY